MSPDGVCTRSTQTPQGSPQPEAFLFGSQFARCLSGGLVFSGSWTALSCCSLISAASWWANILIPVWLCHFCFI